MGVVTVNRDLRALGRELRPANQSTTQPALAGLGWVLRHIPEAVGLLTPATAWRWGAGHAGPVWASVLLGLLVVAVLAWPRSRRVVRAVVMARVTRHRLRTGLLELRLTAHSGKPPVKLLIRPTPVGER